MSNSNILNLIFKVYAIFARIFCKSTNWQSQERIFQVNLLEKQYSRIHFILSRRLRATAILNKATNSKWIAGFRADDLQASRVGCNEIAA